MKAIQIISQDLFDKVRSRFQNLEMGDETGAVTIDPAEARFFDFDFVYEGTNLGRVSISLNDLGSLKIYYSQGITENQDDISKKLWYSFLKEMRLFAMRRLLRFDTRDIAKSNLDKNDFQHLAVTQGPKEEEPMNVNESRWTQKSSKKTSRAVKGATEVIVRHHKPVDEMFPGARSQRKNIKAIFIQNRDGERFKYPFIHPAGAFAMAQHVDHGGVPHDPAGKAIIRMSEQIAQLQEFQKQVQHTQLHDDAMGITERAIGRLHELKAQIESLSKRHHYESWMSSFSEQDQPLMAELDPVTLEQYKSKFTQTNFKEELANYFPLIHSIMQETNTIDLEQYVNEEIGYDEVSGKSAMYILQKIDQGVPLSTILDDFPELSRMIDRIAGEQGLHPDDDIEEIENVLINDLEELADNYDQGQSNENDFSKFEAWAEAVEQGKLTDDQISELKQAIEELPNGQLELGPDGQTAWQFFSSFGLEDGDLEEKLKQAAGLDPTTDPIEVLQVWANDNYPELLVALGISGAEKEQPVSAEPAPDVGATPEQPVAEGKNDWIQEVAKLVKSRYNAANESVGPFNGFEGIALDVKKEISEKFGEKLGEKSEILAKQFMEKLTREWEERHGKPAVQSVDQDDGLARLKELLGNVKAKVESINGQMEGSGPKEKQKTPYRDINSPEYRAAADKQKEKMAKDKAAEPGKALAKKIDQKNTNESEITSIMKLAGLAK